MNKRQAAALARWDRRQTKADEQRLDPKPERDFVKYCGDPNCPDCGGSPENSKVTKSST